jgi:hypothetical protein
MPPRRHTTEEGRIITTTNTPEEAMREAISGKVVKDDAGHATIDLGTPNRREKPNTPMVEIRNGAGTVHKVPRSEVQYLLSKNPRWELVDPMEKYEGDEFMVLLQTYTEAQLREAAEKLMEEVPAKATKAYLAAKVFEEGGLDLMESLFPAED